MPSVTLNNIVGRIKDNVSIHADAIYSNTGQSYGTVPGCIENHTGYQRDRASDAFARILEAFIARELQPWVRPFPSDYYEELFRLRGLDFPRDKVQRPQYFGVLTNDIVYRQPCSWRSGGVEECRSAQRSWPSYGKVLPKTHD
jgi:hypothetical protein